MDSKFLKLLPANKYYNNDDEVKTIYTNYKHYTPCFNKVNEVLFQTKRRNSIDNVSIIVHKKKLNKSIHQPSKLNTYVPQHLLKYTKGSKRTKVFLKKYSHPRVYSDKSTILSVTVVESDIIRKKPHNLLDTNHTVNSVPKYNAPACLTLTENPFSQFLWEVYRCQINIKEESCCCSCNSDAMFEVMKSLYDCYKKKDCDNCDCVLCGHLPAEDKRIREKIKEETSSTKEIRKEKIKEMKAAVEAMKGKSPTEKENILKTLALIGAPLPESKTQSEKELVKKIRNNLGLPPEPYTATDKEKHKKAYAAGLITPLEGKTTPQKRRILKALHDDGIPLPEGRTLTEKSLIEKIKTTHPGVPIGVPSERIRKAKQTGILTSLEGKTPEDKKNILHGLATTGIPLPKGKSLSDQKLISEIRNNLGLPPEPKTLTERKKYDSGVAAGIITPLEGKTPSEKERVLRAQHVIGIPLPQGRTASEKDLIDKIKASPKIPFPSEISILPEPLRKAHTAGFLTPLEGKTPKQKQNILKGLATNRMPLPKGKTPSENNIINQIQTELGLPPEPKTDDEKEKYKAALMAGIITPLEGKTHAQKENILNALHNIGIPLPDGRTPSEKSILGKIQGLLPGFPIGVSSKKLRKAKAAGLLTTFDTKTPETKQKILRGLAMNGIPLPEGKTLSDKKIINKVRQDLGLPQQPKTLADRKKHVKGYAAGIITPLEGKTTAKKEKTLKAQQALGITLPEGRTASEKALIDKIKAMPKIQIPSDLSIPAEKLKKINIAGFFTPLEEKTPEQKQDILKGLAQNGVPLPESKTASEKKILDKVRADLGLPPEPKTAIEKEKYIQAVLAGLLTPLEGKVSAQKFKTIKALHDLGISLPEGRTPSEKSMIKKVKALPPGLPEGVPPDKFRKAKAAGLITPLEGKTPEHKEVILRGLAMNGIPLPEPKTVSDKKLTGKVIKALGLPPKPKTPTEKKEYDNGLIAGIIKPLEGKTPAQKEKSLRIQHVMGMPLPEGRTTSEKKLIDKIKSLPKFKFPSGISISPINLRKAQAAGLLTPIAGKTPEQKQKILRGLVANHIPLPESKSPSEIASTNKVRTELGLPPEPKTTEEKEKHKMAMAAGILTPLEGKTAKQKQKIIKAQHDASIPLPEGRTPSEKILIEKIKKLPPGLPAGVPVDKFLKAKAAGFITPLKGKTPKEKERILRGLAISGIPLPETKTISDKNLHNKVIKALGLPPQPKTSSERKKYKKGLSAGIITPLEGKTLPQKEKVLRAQRAVGIPLPEGRTTSEKDLIEKIKALPRIPFPSGISILSEKIKTAKSAGLITPLKGKTPEQAERILKALADHGIPLPVGKTPSENKLLTKVRAEIGLPPEPKTGTEKEKYNKATAAGIITPLGKKSPAQKEKILKALYDSKIPLPEGRTNSEKKIIDKLKASPPGIPVGVQLDEKRKAKSDGLLTPLEGMTPKEKETILRRLAMNGLPLPDAKSSSDKLLINKVRNDLGLPLQPKTLSERKKYDKGLIAGIVTPLEGKTPTEMEKTLRAQHAMGILLPEGRTPSEKALINKINALSQIPFPSGISISPEKLKKAKAAGLLTPLTGKSPEQKENIVKGLAKHGIPLPKGNTPSERKLLDKVRINLGLPLEPTTVKAKVLYNKALTAGIITPLEGKTPSQKEKILKAQHDAGIPLPEGRTPSEKALIAKIKSISRVPLPIPIPSEKLRKAKAAGLITSLEGKTLEQKEKILKGLAINGIPLPTGKTPSENKLIDKVRANVGLPAAPKIPEEKRKYDKALAAGIMTPLEGKTSAQKFNALRAQHTMGIPLPEGRTPSEKALIDKVKALPTLKFPSGVSILPENLRKAKAAGLLTPIAGKTPAQKENILKGLAFHGIPMPKATTPSEKTFINKFIDNMGLPAQPKTTSDKEKFNRAQAAGLITPLEGKTHEQKENILKGQASYGLPLPKGRTNSEKSLIRKLKNEINNSETPALSTEKLKQLDKKTAQSLKEGKGPSGECICPLFTSQTEREKEAATILKLFKEPGKLTSENLIAAKAAGLLTPLTGKTPQQMEKILRGLVKHRIPLPEAKTLSEKQIIDRVRSGLGLSSEPQTPSLKEKYSKAQDAGIITHIEGKTSKEKVAILKRLADSGIPLPEGRTASEKSLVKKFRQTFPKPLVPISSEKMRMARAAGLITPLEGKTPDDKVKILKGLAMYGIPLPVGKTPSENKLINEIRVNVGLPPVPKTASAKSRYNRAIAAGIITPLEGKSDAQKKKILKAQHDVGLPLPDGRTPSEKVLVNKIRATPRQHRIVPYFVPLAKLKKAKAAGLITPLEGKTKKEKSIILKGLAMHGIPLPEGKTLSEIQLIDNVRANVGLPLEPTSSEAKEKYRRALIAGIITPLEGKTIPQIKKVLKAEYDAGLPLPVGRNPLEKALVAKIKGMPRVPKSTPAATIPTEKLRKEKAAGFITPLEGKTSDQKEKLLKGLANNHMPLPTGKTISDQKLFDKIRNDFGLPPEPKSSSAKIKYNKALTDGIFPPLEGKSMEQKEKILKAEHDAGLLQPKGRTSTEEKIINKLKATPKASLLAGIPSEKLRKALAAGLFTPLTSKEKPVKEKVIRGLADMGLPLPKGTTPSEKSMIQKVQGEFGIPPEPKTSSEKKIIERARTEGILTPLTGKSPAKIEQIIKGLAAAGLPIPKGTSRSEKTFIKKIRAELGLPPIPTPSEKKRKIKTKSKKVGEGGSITGSFKDISVSKEFEGIVKTTKCDQGCGCDKKRIRFKHSYVKIRVTSPDLSALCPCPDECIPKVKHEITADDEGIQVTVGSATGVPSCSTVLLTDKTNSIHSNTMKSANSLTIIFPSYHNMKNDNLPHYIPQNVSSENILANNLECLEDDSDLSSDYSYFALVKSCSSGDSFSDNIFNVTSCRPYSISCNSLDLCTSISRISFGSILTVKTDTSLSLSRKSFSSENTVGYISLEGSCFSSNLSVYLSSVRDPNIYSDEYDESEITCQTINYDSLDLFNRKFVLPNHPKHKQERQIYNVLHQDVFVYRLSQRQIPNKVNRNRSINDIPKSENSIVVISDLNNNRNIMDVVNKIITRKSLSEDSSIFLVMPTSDESNTNITVNDPDSTICIQVTDNHNKWVPNTQDIGIKFKKNKKRVKVYAEKEKTTNKHSRKQQVKDTSTEMASKKDRSASVDLITKPCSCLTKNIMPVDQNIGRSFVVSNIISSLQLNQDDTQALKCIAEHKPSPAQLPQRPILRHQQPSAPSASCSVDCSSTLKCIAEYKPSPAQLPQRPILRHQQPSAPSASCSVDCSSTLKCIAEHKPSPAQLPQRPILRHQQPSAPSAPCSVACSSNLCKETSTKYVQEQCKYVSATCSPIVHLQQTPQLCQYTHRNVKQQHGGTQARPYLMKDSNPDNCNCSLEYLKKLFERVAKEINKDVNNFDNLKNKLMPHAGGETKNNYISTREQAQGDPCPSCPGKDKEKKRKRKKNTCSCDAYTSNPTHDDMCDKNSKSCQCCICTDNKKSKQISKARKNKKNICDCTEPELNIDYDALEKLKEENLRVERHEKLKMISEMTQTTSGFKLRVQKRQTTSIEITSFEDALKYFEDHPEEIPMPMVSVDGCVCEEKKLQSILKKKHKLDVECTCEMSADEEATMAGNTEEQQQMTGFKFSIGAKGSASKGLAGICCFNEHNTQRTKSPFKSLSNESAFITPIY